MGLFSSKKSSNTSVNNSVNTSNSVGVSGNDNFALSGVGGDVSYTTTDHGSIEMAGELASESLALAGFSVENALDFGSGALNGAFEFGAFSLSESLGSVNQMAQNQSELASQSMQLANSVNASLATKGESDINAQNTKAMIAIALIAALVLLVALFRN